MSVRLFAIVCLFLCLSACEKEPGKTSSPPPEPKRAVTEAPAVPLEAPPVFSAAVETALLETTNEALPIWRRFAKHRPLLAVVAQAPGLAPIPEEKREEALELLQDADDAGLKTASGTDTPDPVILPPMSVSAALAAGWFSGVVWIFPSSASPDKLDPDLFRQQIVEAGFCLPEEARNLAFADGVFRGTVRGRSFIAAPLAAIPPLDRPVLLHIDSDYFKPLYKGEIKTPLHPLLYETLTGLKSRGWKVAAATVSLSNLGTELPLQTRFLGGEIADILLDPGLLGGDLPQEWQERANALYLENFMQKDKQREIYEKLEKQEPADPSLKYALYHLARQSNKGDTALDYLQQAVRIDPIYALEYLALADLALQKGKPEKAVEMSQLARSARPKDPFVLLLAARSMINAGAAEQAKALLPELSGLQWSKIYYPALAQETEGLIDLLKN